MRLEKCLRTEKKTIEVKIVLSNAIKGVLESLKNTSEIDQRAGGG